MNDLTIRSAKAQQNLLEWSQRVADCRSSGLAVTRWCADHGISKRQTASRHGLNLYRDAV